jgi:hypothetical protein
VGVIAWLALRRADAFLARREPSALFEVDEAVEFVASALPADVSGQLTYDDVEVLLGWHLMVLAERDQPGEIADAAAVESLAERAAAEGRPLTRAQIRAVLDAEVAYLDAVGAVADEPET